MTDAPGQAPTPDPAWDAPRAEALISALAALTAPAADEAERGLDPAGRALALRLWLQASAGRVSPAALARVVREAEGARLHAANALRLAVCGTVRTAELARARFGAAPAMSALATPERALAAASDAVVAAVALDATPWWGRLLAQPALQVFARLPAAGPAAALAVARVRTAPSGGDETFWATDASGSAARIEAALGDAGFAADLVAEAGGLKLFALAGYVQADDGRLARAPGRLTGVIGAAPTGLP